jgi:hypothetical protein
VACMTREDGGFAPIAVPDALADAARSFAA